MKPLSQRKVSTSLRSVAKPLLHALFGGSMALLLSAYFEQNLKLGVPFWSSVLGCPIPHHGYLGFIIAISSYAALIYVYEGQKQ